MTDFQGLRALARAQGGDIASNRGACKVCGGLGHLTKQCRNLPPAGGAATAAAGASAAGSGRNGLGLLTEADDAELELVSLSGDDDSGSSSGSSSSDSGRDRKRVRWMLCGQGSVLGWAISVHHDASGSVSGDAILV